MCARAVVQLSASRVGDEAGLGACVAISEARLGETGQDSEGFAGFRGARRRDASTLILYGYYFRVPILVAIRFRTH